MRIAIINGPNLNLLGTRETMLYGTTAFDDYLPTLRTLFPQDIIDYYQSNIEGELINVVQHAAQEQEGIVLNAAAYSHTSIALADTLRAVTIPVVEVHISNVLAREKYRHHSLTAAACQGVISGLGIDGYRLAIEALHMIHDEKNKV